MSCLKKEPTASALFILWQMFSHSPYAGCEARSCSFNAHKTPQHHHTWVNFSLSAQIFPPLEKVSGTTETWDVVRNMFANTQAYRHKISKGHKKDWQNWRSLQSAASYLTSNVCTSTHFTLDGRWVFLQTYQGGNTVFFLLQAWRFQFLYNTCEEKSFQYVPLYSLNLKTGE